MCKGDETWKKEGLLGIRSCLCRGGDILQSRVDKDVVDKICESKRGEVLAKSPVKQTRVSAIHISRPSTLGPKQTLTSYMPTCLLQDGHYRNHGMLYIRNTVHDIRKLFHIPFTSDSSYHSLSFLSQVIAMSPHANLFDVCAFLEVERQESEEGLRERALNGWPLAIEV